jgi:hypothetical protein
MSLDVCPNLVELSRRETVIVAQHDGFQPKFAKHIFTSHMDVGWFITVEAVEEESIGTRNVFDSRHGECPISPCLALYTTLKGSSHEASPLITNQRHLLWP